MERAGVQVEKTYQANPGEVWEEAEFWIDLSVEMDKDGSLGIRQWFESPYRDGEIISMDEYWQWIFEHSVPGLPEAAAKEGLTPLAYMKKYGAFEITNNKYEPYTAQVDAESVHNVDTYGAARDADGKVVGIEVGDAILKGFGTPSGKFEFFSPTIHDWGWPEQQYTIPWPLKVTYTLPTSITQGEMLLLPNFRLPTLIHTRSANSKWL